MKILQLMLVEIIWILFVEFL